MSRKNTTTTNYAADWIGLGNVKLKFDKVYERSPPLNLRNSIHFAACPYGGPVALADSLSSGTSWSVSIRNSAGGLISNKFEVADVLHMEWSKCHRLVICDRRGRARLFAPTGEQTSTFHFSKDVREVKEARVLHTARDSGVAILDDGGRFFVANSAEQPIVWTINTPRGCATPSCWCAVQPHSQLTAVAMAAGRDLYTASQGEHMTKADAPWAESDGEYVRMTPSWDHSRLALYHSTRLIQVASSDLSQLYSSIRVPGDLSIYRLGWVGSDALFLQRTPTFIQFFAVGEEDACYEMRCDFTQVAVEPDGVRLFEEQRMQFASVVHSSEEHVLGVASSAEGAFLHEASQLAANKSAHRAYEYALMVRDMAGAIGECVECAKHCARPATQKALLQAARFGTAFLASPAAVDAAELVEVVRVLRVLNELRTERVGLPLTYAQCAELSLSSLLGRLMDVRAWPLAIRVSEWMEREACEGVDRVLLAWVRHAIDAASADRDRVDVAALDAAIAHKLSAYPHVSMADAAGKAVEAKLPGLARLLIKRETDEKRQVEILLQLRDVNEALARAAAAQRPQLMHLVIRYMAFDKEQKLRRDECERIINKIPQAKYLYQDYLRQTLDSEKRGNRMLALLKQTDDFDRRVLFHLDELSESWMRDTAASRFEPDPRLAALKEARDVAAESRDTGLTELLNEAVAASTSRVEGEFDVRPVRQRVIEAAADPTAVLELKQQHKIPEKQVWLWTIEGLARAGKWDSLYELSKKKSPVGYVPFVRACVAHRRPADCDRYMPKVSGYTDQLAAQLAIGNYVAAAKLAFDRKDHDTLQRVYQKSHKNKEQYQKVGQLVKAL